jgi:hypothetical protein
MDDLRFLCPCFTPAAFPSFIYTVTLHSLPAGGAEWRALPDNLRTGDYLDLFQIDALVFVTAADGDLITLRKATDDVTESFGGFVCHTPDNT